jgi:hypothetical protein
VGGVRGGAWEQVEVSLVEKQLSLFCFCPSDSNSILVSLNGERIAEVATSVTWARNIYLVESSPWPQRVLAAGERVQGWTCV